MTNLDSILKSRDITLPTKVHLVMAMVFPVVMYGCESWTVKKTECQKIDAFELWCWQRLFRVPWTARRSNQSFLKESVLGIHWKDWCWSWNSNTLATWYEELTHWKRPWCWEGLGAGGEGDDRGWDGWMASPTRWAWVWVDSGSWWWIGKPGVLQFMGSQRVRHNWVTELNWLTKACRTSETSSETVFLRWLSGKECACQCRRHRSIPGSGRCPGSGNGKPIQYSCLDNLMDKEPGWLYHRVTKSLMWLSSHAHPSEAVP